MFPKLHLNIPALMLLKIRIDSNSQVQGQQGKFKHL